MDLNLQVKSRGDELVMASWACPCGCNPRLAYQRGDEHVVDGCCCGNEFALGPKAEANLQAGEGFVREIQSFEAPWGERIPAVWTLGQADPAEGHADHSHHDESAARPASVIDPVCGMSVDPESARPKGLHSTHAGIEYFFCGKGCKLEFGDDPERFLDPAYVPSM